MHIPWRAIPVLTLLGLPHMVHPMPTSDGNTLAIRADPDLPKELQPVLKLDHLPKGDPSGAIQDTDFDITLEELKDCEDFDPDGGDSGSKSRLRKRKPRSGTIGALRNVYYKGKRYKEAFILSPDKRFIFLEPKSARNWKNSVVAFETTTEIPQVPNKDWYLQWQPDHVCDLGIFTHLARLDTPKGIKEAAWTKVQDAILGKTQSNGGKASANDNTRILGQLLNSPQNIRGTSAEMNAAKSKLMSWVYSPSTLDTTGFYKKVHRSAAWGTYRHLVRTKVQFDDTMKKASTAIKNFIKDDDESAKAIEKYFNEEGPKLLKKGVDQLAVALKDPPAENPEKSIFKLDDCSNTADSPDVPDSQSNIQPIRISAAPLILYVPSSTPVAHIPRSVAVTPLELPTVILFTPTASPVHHVPTSVAPPTPVAPPPLPVYDSCYVEQGDAFDVYHIRGVNFDEAKLGKNGGGLKKELGGCARFTFHFNLTPNDPNGFTWYANGPTGALQTKCIGHALKSAGGSHNGKCHGLY